MTKADIKTAIEVLTEMRGEVEGSIVELAHEQDFDGVRNLTRNRRTIGYVLWYLDSALDIACESEGHD